MAFPNDKPTASLAEPRADLLPGRKCCSGGGHVTENLNRLAAAALSRTGKVKQPITD
jgi:hypothetical protein